MNIAPAAIIPQSANEMNASPKLLEMIYGKCLKRLIHMKKRGSLVVGPEINKIPSITILLLRQKVIRKD